jgi:hypothetical protein
VSRYNVRKSLVITEEQASFLADAAEMEGRSEADMLRRIIDLYYKQWSVEELINED